MLCRVLEERQRRRLSVVVGEKADGRCGREVRGEGCSERRSHPLAVQHVRALFARLLLGSLEECNPDASNNRASYGDCVGKADVAVEDESRQESDPLPVRKLDRSARGAQPCPKFRLQPPNFIYKSSGIV